MTRQRCEHTQRDEQLAKRVDSHSGVFIDGMLMVVMSAMAALLTGVPPIMVSLLYVVMSRCLKSRFAE